MPTSDLARHRARLRQRDPIAQAEACQALAAAGWSNDAIARAAGQTSRSFVSHRLRLLRLIPDLRGLVRDGRLSLVRARQASVLAAAVQRRLYLALHGGTRWAQAWALACGHDDRARREGPAVPPGSVRAADLEAAGAGVCGACPRTSDCAACPLSWVGAALRAQAVPAAPAAA